MEMSAAFRFTGYYQMDLRHECVCPSLAPLAGVGATLMVAPATPPLMRSYGFISSDRSSLHDN